LKHDQSLTDAIYNDYAVNMPCNDVTEILRLVLDADDRLSEYSLTKLTCGGVLGKEALLKKWCGGLPAREILATDIDAFCAKFPTDDAAVEFVRLKHLLALQKGLSALLGDQSARPDDAIAIESIEHGPLGTQMIALIKVDAVTKEIQSCGRCVGCGTAKTPGHSIHAE
jgi:hypothetical protein